VSHHHADGSLTPVEDYLEVIRSAIRPLAPSVLELADAEDRVLAEDVTAAVSLPPFDNSSMVRSDLR
jgi:molybdopterin molybdotransferase